MNLTEYIDLAEMIINEANYYFGIYVLTIGAFLNILTAAIFTRKVFWATNMGLFYFALSIVNTFAMLIRFLQRFLTSLNYDLSTKSDASCKIFSFLRKYFPLVSSWILVLITFERLAWISLGSTKLTFMKKKKNVWILLGAIFVFIFLIDIENFFFYLSTTLYNSTLNDSNQTEYVMVVSAKCTSSATVGVISNFVSAFVRTIIPFPIMLVLNVIICKILFSSKKHMAKSNHNKSHKKEIHFAFTVVGMNVIFFIFYFPLAISHLTQAVIQLIPTASIWLFTTVNLVYNISSNVAYIYMAINFFLNFLFNYLFRKEIFVMLKIKEPKNDSTFV